MKMFLFLTFLICLSISSESFLLSKITMSRYVLEQTRRAQRYLTANLESYSQQKISKYTLYLAIDNFRQILDELKTHVVSEISNYVHGGNNIVLGKRNIVLGSNNKLAGFDNWILTQHQITSSEVQRNILYFKNWRIKLDYIEYIQYHPEVVIEVLANEEVEMLRKGRSAQDIRKFMKRKHFLRPRNRK